MVEAYMKSITAGSDVYAFRFRALAPIDRDKLQPSLNVPLPNSNPDQQLLFRFAGQSETLSFEFVLYPSDEDLSIGSIGGSTAPAGVFPTGVKTVKEQIQFLMDYVFSDEFNTSWGMRCPSIYNSETYIEGAIESMNINRQPGGANFAVGRLTFKRGNLAGAGNL